MSRPTESASPDVFNALERIVFDRIASRHADGALIRAQLATVASVARRTTGLDVYTTFAVRADPRYRLAAGPLVGDAWAHVRGLVRGMTFLLWADPDGYLTALEGASFGEDISGMDFDAAQIEFYAGPDADELTAPPPSWDETQVPIRAPNRRG